MKEHGISQKDAAAKALKILSAAKTVFLATNGSHGHPNLRAMAPVKTEGVSTLWFSTSRGSSKVDELTHDNKAVVYGYSPRSMSEFRLWGSVEVLDDESSRKLIWTEALGDHFPGGADDPNLLVLRFSAVSGMYAAKDGSGGVFEA
jgi:general stress protein 26